MRFRHACAALCWLAAFGAHAHRSNESQIALRLQADRVQGQWTVGLHDLPAVAPLGIVATDDAAIARQIQARPELALRLVDGLRLAAGAAPCAITPTTHELAQRTGSAVWILRFEARCPTTPARLTVDLRTLFERDPKHLVLLKLEAGAWVRAAVFSADSARQAFQPDQTVRPPSTGNSTPVMNSASSLPR